MDTPHTHFQLAKHLKIIKFSFRKSSLPSNKVKIKMNVS